MSVPLKVAATCDHPCPICDAVATLCHFIPSNMENMATCSERMLFSVSSNEFSLDTIVNTDEPEE